MTDQPDIASSTESFSGRVVVLFATSVVTTGIAIVNGFMLARVLGPSGKGDFYLLTMLPVSVMVLIQLGLPQAFGFFAARGKTVGINTMTLVLTAALCIPALIATLALLPLLRSTVLHSLDPYLIILAMAVLPLMLNGTFTTGILLARHAVRWFAAVNIGLTVTSICLYALVVGVLGLGLVGALWTTLLIAFIGPIGFFIGSARASARVPDAERLSYRELLGYALPLYPGNLTQYFSLRVDVYLLAALVADPSAPLGYYSMAVTMAQLVFFLPNAVSTVFFPHVAGSRREESDRQVGAVSRVTILITAGVAIALIPVATVLIHLILPAFVPALPPFYLLLPGVVALSVTKVLSSYVAGVGRTVWTSYVNVGSLILNLVANLILIPRFGIMGASAASVISYSASTVAFTVLASRLAHGSVAEFWVPRADDVRFVVGTMIGMGRRVLHRVVNSS
jgi:O-antigen/teichoic acid export membrane protein